jgi:polygalacturonase
MPNQLAILAAVVAALISLPCSRAQDTRTVMEPHYPPTCIVLTARLAADRGRLPEESEISTDTVRIQAALDQCEKGKAVALRPTGANNIFLMGPIELRPGVTLIVDSGAAIFASRNPRDYELSPGSCGIVPAHGPGCKSLISANRAPGSGIMGDGAIDARGGARLLGQQITWWDISKRAKVLDTTYTVPRILTVVQSDDFTLYRITLRNSFNFHVSVAQTNGFTAWGVKIKTPKTARNTDGIDPSSSTNVTIAYCDIDTGDDNIAIKTGAEPASHISVVHNHFYSGHGMSIGSGTSGGVSDVVVSDLSIDGADNGIRIKSDRSRGGLVQNISYENVCIRNVLNPIVITPMYTTNSGTRLPIYRDIVLKDVHSLTPGWVTLLGLDAAHKLGVAMDNVTIDGMREAELRIENAVVRQGRRGNLNLGGGDVVLHGGADEAAPMNCFTRFPAFPAINAPEAAVTVPPEDKTLYVAASGTGDFYSIQHAIDVAPPEGAVISIAPGTYREVLKISKPNITLRSPYDDPKQTVIVYDKSAGTSGGTFNSATVEVRAANFTAENLTFANDFNVNQPQLSQGSQALAVSVTADRAIFRNMRFLGNQDTVYVSRGRQYFSNCYIEGNVDFIFGDGKAVFENCEIHNTTHAAGGFVTAQGRTAGDQDSGFVFNHCKLTAAPGVAHVWLGRPWRPYATAIFLNTEMGDHIEPAGWREWHPGETHYMDTVFYAEFNSSGPGAHPAERDPHTKHLTAAEAAGYETQRYLAGSDDWRVVH